MGVHPDAGAFIEGQSHVSGVDRLPHCPDIVLIDMMVQLHRLKVHPAVTQSPQTPLERFLSLWNVLMDEPRGYLATGTQTVVLLFDKGCPQLKHEVVGEKRASSNATQGVFPYPSHFSIDEETGEFLDGEGKPLPDVDIQRVIATRPLRLKLFRLFANVFFPLEQKQLKEGQQWIMDYSTDAAISPLLLSVGGIDRKPSLNNKWLESDHSGARMIVRLLEERETTTKEIVVLFRSIDRDMIPILLQTLVTLANRDVQIYFNSIYHKPPSKSNPKHYSGGLYHINQMLFLLANHHLSVEAIMLICCLCGNDYVSKDKITPWLGVRNDKKTGICEQIQRMGAEKNPLLIMLLGKLASYTGTGATAQTTGDYQLLVVFIDALYKQSGKGSKLPPNDKEIRLQYINLVRAFAYWMECPLFDAPKNGLNQADNNPQKTVSLRSETSIHKEKLVEGGDFRQKRSKTPSPNKPPRVVVTADNTKEKETKEGKQTSIKVPISIKDDPRLKLHASLFASASPAVEMDLSDEPPEPEYDPDDPLMNPSISSVQ